MSILKLFKHFQRFHNTADLPERTVRSFDYTPVATLSDCLNASSPAITEMVSPGVPLPPSPLLFPEFANVTVSNDHNAAAAKPVAIYVASAPDVIVSGFSAVGSETNIFGLSPVEPDYVVTYFQQRHRAAGDRSLARKKEMRLDGWTAVVTHWNSNTYGHWLLECLPKLFLLRTLRDHLPDLKIAVSDAVSRDVTRWASLLLPDVPLVTFNHQKEYLRCARAVFPGMLCNGSYFFHPAMNDCISAIRETTGTADGRRRIFIVRADEYSFRKLANKSEIANIAAAHGFDLIQPEKLSIADQVKIFASASVIVGEFGSAMHNAMFSDDASVLCLGWISGIQSRIAALRGQPIGYLLPTDRSIIKFENDMPSKNYSIDPGEFAEALKRMPGLSRKA